MVLSLYRTVHENPSLYHPKCGDVAVHSITVHERRWWFAATLMALVVHSRRNDAAAAIVDVIEFWMVPQCFQLIRSVEMVVMCGCVGSSSGESFGDVVVVIGSSGLF
ncbi:Hypothetical predicted protein [Olea europaea subsp. europaea]|uniref:Uncharacterized protein n=1 Tax=Olea europaea subsp. europaea TaxID=158383 RepID=A0A8S0R8C2_OLEEU|nr:Hypothetical predicted protein [Olea europaea subsp. europaea]